MNGADGDDDVIMGIGLATGDGLPAVDDLRRENDWVLRFVRIRAVPAHSFHTHVDRIDVRVAVTFRDADLAGGNLRVVVKAEDVGWFWPARVEPVLQ